MVAGKPRSTSRAEFEIDTAELRRRSDEILAIISGLADIDGDGHKPAPEARSSEGAAEVLEAPATETQRPVADRQILVHEWLAQQIGCAAEELAVIERRGAAFDVVFSRNGERYGEAYLLAPKVPGGWKGSIALIAVWKPGRWSQEILEPNMTVAW